MQLELPRLLTPPGAVHISACARPPPVGPVTAEPASHWHLWRRAGARGNLSLPPVECGGG
eukprot:7080774-Alexandrium_andersonii.AAC.1